MGKKKVAKKVPKKEYIEDRKDAVLTPAEITRFKVMLERIGSRKSRGVIYMIEIKDEDLCDGLLFAHKMSKANIAGNLIEQLKMNPLSLISVMSASMGRSED